jgi:N-acylneuraminate cytidylyltransferase
MNICIIPARGGSKRILRKNIKVFNGKRMILYSIKAAILSGCFDKVVVSTDDEEIARIAKESGADVPFMRPSDLSGDYIATMPVINHAIDWFEEHGFNIDNVCCLYATAPFVQAYDIKTAYKQLINSDADYCFSVTSFSFPIQRSIMLTENNRVTMFDEKYMNTRSQDLVEAFHDAGQFYWGKTEAFKLEKPMFSECATPYILPRHLVQDIDTKEDWDRAELMHRIVFE